MSQMFKLGDLVVCVDDSKSNFTLKKGNTYRVNGTAPEIIFPGYITLEGFSCFSYFNPDRFKLTEETPKTQSFKPGDLVVCVDDIDTQGKLEHGKTYKVIKSDSYFTFLEGLRDDNKGFYSGRFELVEETPKTQSFKVGDICSAFGCEGRVVNVFNDAEYPIEVKFENDTQTCWFIKGGKYQTWHKTPSLVLVSRPKKMVTKTVEKWINVYPNHAGGFYSDEKNADEYAQQNRIACVKLTGTYEVEED